MYWPVLTLLLEMLYSSLWEPKNLKCICSATPNLKRQDLHLPRQSLLESALLESRLVTTHQSMTSYFPRECKMCQSVQNVL